MNYLDLLNKALKSSHVLDLLETYDMEVIYEFDRLRENIPDKYLSKSSELGLEIVFDENQILKTIFIHVEKQNGFEPANLEGSDIHPFSTKQDIVRFAQENGFKFSVGATECRGTQMNWIRLEFQNFSIHYEFRPHTLALITITAI